MSDEKWYWKGNGVFKKDELIKKMKEDIIPDDKKTNEKGYKYLLEEDKADETAKNIAPPTSLKQKSRQSSSIDEDGEEEIVFEYSSRFVADEPTRRSELKSLKQPMKSYWGWYWIVELELEDEVSIISLSSIIFGWFREGWDKEAVPLRARSLQE